MKIDEEALRIALLLTAKTVLLGVAGFSIGTILAYAIVNSGIYALICIVLAGVFGFTYFNAVYEKRQKTKERPDGINIDDRKDKD